MHKKLAVLLTAAISFSSYATEITPEFTKEVFLNLDVTSFNNGMRPMHYDDGTTMQQTFKTKGEPQITTCEWKGNKNCIEIFFPHQNPWYSASGGAHYYLRIISANKEGIMACFTEHCNGDCNYSDARPIKIKEQRGKYIVVKQYEESIEGCESYGGG